METLTGKTRFRLHKPFMGDPVLVLQVQVRYQINYDRSDIYDIHPDIVNIDELRWRDAKVEDGVHAG